MVSSPERLELIQTLSSIPEAQFKQVVFALDPPKGSLPTETSQGKTAAALLDWVESPTGRGMRALRGILADLGITSPAPAGVCPYKGLSYFDCNNEDYKYFYGREALTQTLLDRVNQDNFLAIVGASGSGKSSVLRAGLLQRLKEKGDSEIRILVPGEHPLQSLARAFIDEESDRLDRAAQQAKAEALIAGGADGLRRLVQNSDTQRVVLVVDQFEESFTLCQDKTERQTFFETLLGGLETTLSQLYLILVMRSDFVGKCFEEDYKTLAAKVKNHLEPVQVMTPEELTQAIEEPARQAGVALEPGLTGALLKDLAQSPGGLPLLQYTLTELWKRQQDNQLKLSVYHQLGGVTGTLQKRADEVYQSLTPEQQQTARHIFLSLTQLWEGAEDTRRRVTQDSLSSAQHPEAQVAEVVKRLADANLVVTDARGDTSQGEHKATVDVAHEALIRTWPTLRRWLESNRDLLRQQRKIELAADEWSRKKHQKYYLLEGRTLSDALRFRKKHTQDFPLSNQAQALLNRGLRQRRVEWLTFSILLILPLTLTYFIIEPTIRRSRIQEARAQIRQKGDGTRDAVEYVVRGCPMHRKLSNWPISESIVSTVFGDCISLSTYDLSDAGLNFADLSGADLSGADLNGTDLIAADLRNALLSSAVLNGADLRGADLRNASLSGAVLTRANLSGAVLLGANLNEANLSGADLRGADLRGADLRGADLDEAKLCRTTLPEASTLKPNRDCEELGIDPETGERL